MTGAASAQTLTITGTGFTAGTGLKVVLTSGSTTTTYQGAQITSSSATQIQVAASLGTATQNWTVKVVNPNGSTSSGSVLQVVAPVAAPAITSLSPNPITGSASTATLAINGTGFTAGTGLKVVLTSGSTTVTYQGAQITSVSATQIQVVVSPGTAAQNWTVMVVNPNGQASNGVSLQVTAPAAPAITSISPNPMTGSNAYQILTINGTGFSAATGWKVVLSGGGTTVTLPASQISVTSTTQILAQVNVGTTAQTWSVQVVNPSGVASNAASLTVTAPAAVPTITSLAPNPMTKSATAQTLTVNGTGFQSGSGLTVKLTSGGVLITVPGSAIKFVSSSQLTMPVIVGASARTYSVTVENPNGQISNAVNLTVQ